MSFILDALKKSEQERKRGKVPDLQSIQVAVRPFRKSSVVKILFLSIWAIGTVVLIALWLQQKYRVSVVVHAPVAPAAVVLASATAVPEVAPTITSPAIMPAVESAIDAQPTIETEPVLDAELLMDEADLQAGSEIIRPKQARHAKTPPQPKTAAVAPQAAAATETVDATEDWQYLPQLSQMPQTFTSTLPKLDFISHLYSSDAASRSVIINGKTWHERDRILPTLELIAIIPDGVVLSYQGKQFRMPVIQDWSGQ
jgi:general secretion pathway protein B